LQAEAAALRAELAQLQHLVAEAQTRAQTAVDQDTALRRRLESGSEELAQLGRAVDQRRQTLQRLEAELLARGRNLSALRRDLDRERRRLARLHRATAEARTAIARAQTEANAEAAAKPTPEPVAAKPAQEGFSLRFGSDAALIQLVRARRVSLLVLAAERAWRLELDAEGPRFAPAEAPPRRFHEMTPESVPSALVRALQRDPGINRRESVTWAVQLPGDIAQAIRRAMSSRRSGTLLIGADGRVRVEEFGP
jgi:hypothetical protein